MQNRLSVAPAYLSSVEYDLIMSGFFKFDGPVFRIGNIAADIMLLGVLWFVFSVPLFTVGAATTALFYVTTRRISDREGSLVKEFITSFKSNFKRATLIWLLWVLIAGIALVNIFILWYFTFPQVMIYILLPIFIVLMAELFMISVYLYPLNARFKFGFRQTIKYAVFMSARHFFSTLACVILCVAVWYLGIFVFPPMVLVAMGLYGFISSFFIMRVFKKYIPKIDDDG